MVVVAGIGMIRPTDLDHQNAGVQYEVKPYSNCAAVIGPATVEFVTKQYQAEGEFIQAGTGPRVFHIKLHDREIALGVAICLDYIHRGHAFGDKGADLDG